jgi:hypothetical protein
MTFCNIHNHHFRQFQLLNAKSDSDSELQCIALYFIFTYTAFLDDRQFTLMINPTTKAKAMTREATALQQRIFAGRA